MFSKRKRALRMEAKRELDAEIDALAQSVVNAIRGGGQRRVVNVQFRNGGEVTHSNVAEVANDGYYTIVLKRDGFRYSYPNKDVKRIKSGPERADAAQ